MPTTTKKQSTKKTEEKTLLMVEEAIDTDPTSPVSGISKLISKRNFKKNLPTLGVITFILIAIGAYFFSTKVYPRYILITSFAKLEQSQSFTIKFVPDPSVGDFSASLNFQNDRHQYSQFDLDFPQIDPDAKDSLSVSLISSRMEGYFNLEYSEIDELLPLLDAFLPNVSNTETYRLSSQFLTNPSTWLYFSYPDIPEDSDSDKAEIEEYEEIAEGFIESVAITNFNPNFTFQDRPHHRIVFGLDKDKLLKAIESLKDTTIDLSIADINNTIDFIKSTDGLDKNLVEILIDRKTKYISQIIFSFPEISAETLQSEDMASPYFQMLRTELEKAITDIETDNPNRTVGTLIFTDYDQTEKVSLPESTVSFDELLAAFQEEITPLLGSLLMNTGSSLINDQPTINSSPLPSAPNPTANPFF